MAGSEEEERVREREAGLGGEGSKVWEIVVVAVTMEVRRWDMSMSAGLKGRLENEEEGACWKDGGRFALAEA